MGGVMKDAYTLYKSGAVRKALVLYLRAAMAGYASSISLALSLSLSTHTYICLCIHIYKGAVSAGGNGRLRSGADQRGLHPHQAPASACLL